MTPPLARRADARQTEHILRVNAATVHGHFPLSADDRAMKSVKGNTRFIPRQKAANEALARSVDYATNRPAYRTGDGETQLTRRPGSDDHLKHKSLGFGTYKHLEPRA